MVTYEVNLQVDAAIADEYRAWLRGHVAELLALPGFLDATVFDVREPVEPGRIGLCVHYRLRDGAALDAYLRKDAPRMREAGVARFGGRFSASRRVLLAQ
jgi:hypothetical protein